MNLLWKVVDGDEEVFPEVDAEHVGGLYQLQGAEGDLAPELLPGVGIADAESPGVFRGRHAASFLAAVDHSQNLPGNRV